MELQVSLLQRGYSIQSCWQCDRGSALTKDVTPAAYVLHAAGLL